MDARRKREIEEETRTFALEVIKLHRSLRGHRELWPITDQLSRAANSVAANHRAMSRARSDRDFASKLHIVHEEADETAHWLEMIQNSLSEPELKQSVTNLLREARQLRNFFGRARATTRRRYFRS
jgi:four helix bundle protein